MRHYPPKSMSLGMLVPLSLVMVSVLWLVGLPSSALACLVTLPLSYFQTWFTKRGLMNPESGTRAVLGVLLRNGLSVAALAVGFFLGPEILLGVFLALCVEAFTYMLRSVRLFVRR